MPTALIVKDITAIDIDTPRGSDPAAYRFDFKSSDGVTTFGHIHDSADTFTDGDAIGTGKALRVDVVSESENRSVLDFDFLTITTDLVTGLKIWFPPIAGAGTTTLYVDSDGNTYTDAALTTAAGGVSLLADSATLSETFFLATEFLTDTVTLSDAIGANYLYEISLSDTVNLELTFTYNLNTLTFYLNEYLKLSDSISSAIDPRTFYLNEYLNITDSVILSMYGDFEEDTQTDLNWTEV